jgi:hypothetical protein
VKKPIVISSVEQISLVEDFIALYKVAIDELSSIGAITDATSVLRAREAAIAAVASDPKFRAAWADPEFQAACSAALQSKAKEVNNRFYLRAKMGRYGAAVAAAEACLPSGRKLELEELEKIAEKCDVTEEDLDQLLLAARQDLGEAELKTIAEKYGLSEGDIEQFVRGRKLELEGKNLTEEDAEKFVTELKTIATNTKVDIEKFVAQLKAKLNNK